MTVGLCYTKKHTVRCRCKEGGKDTADRRSTPDCVITILGVALNSVRWGQNITTHCVSDQCNCARDNMPGIPCLVHLPHTEHRPTPVHEGSEVVISYANDEGSSRRSEHVLTKYRYSQKQLYDKNHPIAHHEP